MLTLVHANENDFEVVVKNDSPLARYVLYHDKIYLKFKDRYHEQGGEVYSREQTIW